MDPYRDAPLPSNIPYFYDTSHPQTFSNAYHQHNSIPPAPYNSPRPILEDDRRLFENVDRFPEGNFDQKFRAAYCKRLLFTWEWVLHLCFLNYNQALKTWYRLLGETGDEDIWLWVDGDEEQSHEVRLITIPNGDEGSDPTALHPLCALSQANIKKAVEILRVRSQGHDAPASLPPWRRQLDACGKSYLRFMAVAFAIATSRPLRALDSDRGIEDRTVWSLLTNLEDQLSSYWQENTEAQPHQCQAYIARLEAAGHTCTEDWRYTSESPCALLELVSLTSPDRQIHLPIYWPEDWCHYDEDISCSQCEESRPLLLTDISWRVQAAGALAEETLHTSAPKKYLHLLWWLWCTWRSRISGSAAVVSDVDEWLQWLRLLALQPTVDVRQNGDDHRAAHGPTRVIRHLLSQRMAKWLGSDHCHRDEYSWDYLLADSYSTSCQNICGLSDTSPPGSYFMYIPSSNEWQTAEDILGQVTAAPYGNDDPVDPQSVCGVLAWWALNGGVTSHLPDYYSFLEVIRLFDNYGIFFDSQPDPQEELISRIQKDKPKCCGDFNKEDLDWYLVSASLLLPESAISTDLVWRCRCHPSDNEVIRVFVNYSTEANRWSLPRERYLKKECGKLLDLMIDTAEGYGFDSSVLRDRRQIIPNTNNENSLIVDRPTSGNDQTEQHVDRPPFRAEIWNAAELQQVIQAAEKELQRRGLPAPTAQTLPKSDTKISKSAQAEHVKKYLVNLLQELENSTRQILELVPRGKQKGSSLPWKSLPQILLDRGCEFQNWPKDVPVPGSGSTLCDDNKGIHGLNAKHLRALYDATLSEDRPLRFRKVVDGVSAQARLEEASMRGIRRGRDEESDDGAVEAGPSKRSRPSAPDEDRR